MRTAVLSRKAAVLAAACAVAAGALAAVGAGAPAVAAVATPVSASHAVVHGPATATHSMSRPGLPAGERYVCPAPAGPGEMTCMSVIRWSKPGTTSPAAAGARPIRGYGPSDLRSAYKLGTAAEHNGHGRTIAVVDAFSDPHAAADLAVYRAHYHLPSCTATSGCLRILNEHGKAAPLPRADWDWAGEESLDLDMVSAVCPNCHILLIEANSPSTADLGSAENVAVARGARYVSNSWSGQEFTGQDFFNRFFNHPGVAIDFASGDADYGAGYPTDLQYVTSIGGTALRHTSGGRGWTESVWGPGTEFNREGTASGCSTLEPKPSWQRVDANEPDGCLNRTENDVAAVADPNTGVAMYDTWRSPEWPKGWNEFGGTSAATPIITGIYALAGTPTQGTYPAEYPYLHSSHLFDVKTGANGRCESFRQYLCHGEPGYDGPTGLGTPDGTAAFTDRDAHRLTLLDPGTQDIGAGSSIGLEVIARDTRRGAAPHYSMKGLPAGVSIMRVPHTASGRITGHLPTTPATYHVTVTAKDGSVTGTTRFLIVIVPSLAMASASGGQVRLSAGSNCLETAGGVGAAVRIQACTADTSEQWTYVSDGLPDDAGVLMNGTLCLGLHSTAQHVERGTLASCNGTSSQRWVYLGFGSLGNVGKSGCLAVSGQAAGTPTELASCTGSATRSWRMPAGPIVSATSLCLDDPGNSAATGTRVQAGTCGGTAEQRWTLRADGTISSGTGLCLSGHGSLLSGVAMEVEFCDGTRTNPDLTELWLPGPGGELINIDSGRCLAVEGAVPGTILRQEDCYGEAGEVWGLN